MSSVGGIKAGRAFVELGADDSQLRAVLRRAEQRLNATAKSIRTIGIGLTSAGGAIVAPLVAAAVSAAKYGDALNDLSVKTGVAVRDLAALEFAAGQSGTTIEDVASSINKMQRNLEEAAKGSQSANDAFGSLGLTLDSLRNKSPDQQFELIADRISKLDSASKRTAAAMAIFGRSGANLLPMFKNGAAGLRAYREEAERLGLILSADTAASVGEFDDALAKAKAQIQGVKNVTGAAIASALLPYEDAINNILAATIKWVAANGDLVVSVGSIGAISLSAGVALLGISAALNIVAGAIKVVSTAVALLSANPIVAIGIALAAATAGIVLYARSATKAHHDISTTAQESTRAMDAARESDFARVRSLEQLANAGKLSDRQMAQAVSLVDSLESRYGPLGITIDKTTGSINGMSDGLGRLNKLMQENAKIDLDNEIKSIDKQIANVEESFREANDDWWDGIEDVLQNPKILFSRSGTSDSANAAAEAMGELLKRRGAAMRRRLALDKQATEDLLTGQTPKVDMPATEFSESPEDLVEKRRVADFLENLSISEARASGNNRLADQLEILRDFKKTLEEIKGLALSGTEFDFGVSTALKIAEGRLAGLRSGVSGAQRRSEGVFNPNAIASLNQLSRARDTTTLLRTGLSKQDDIITQLKAIVANIVPTYEQ